MNRHKSTYKKSQIKFGETFAVLIVVYFAFIFGSQFYISSLENSLDESKTQSQETQALETLDLVLNYPLFLNSNLGSKTKTLNTLNIQSFSQLDNITKNSIFKNTLITLTMYDTSFNEKSQSIKFEDVKGEIIVIHNNSKQFYEDSKFIGKRIIPHTSIVNVYNPKEDTTDIAILSVRSYY